MPLVILRSGSYSQSALRHSFLEGFCIPVHRRLESSGRHRTTIVHERSHLRYTNWGPLTMYSTFSEVGMAVHFRVAVMDRTSRKALEAIAEREPVRKPDGESNYQDWIESVLDKAVRQTVVSRGNVEDVLDQAKRCGSRVG
ncbi:hypothetical protein OBBRIDRAFT_835607 [Obba rivulosa]|uniref:Uncharacterized protein n=1 Tax=Obba rivulosa TaxID=1052685 RepID=A0A8E2AWY7_9APHY|nr:hypothetical protein OBBRIDRAFT_835607 [Obba rivulosa]